MDVGSSKQLSQYGFGNWGSDKQIGTWTLAGSNDLTTWVAVDSRVEVTTNHYSFSRYIPNGYGAGNSYQYYRFIVRGLLDQPYYYGSTTQFVLCLEDTDNEFLQPASSTGSVNFGNGSISVGLGTNAGDTSRLNNIGAGPSQAGYYYGTNNAYTGTVYTTVEIGSPPTAPTGPPTSLSWVDTYNGSIAISFTPGGDGNSAITNYEYSFDNGTTFISPSPPQTSSPLTITGLTNRTNYTIIIRPVNAVGDGPSSDPLSLRYLCFLEGTRILCFNSDTQLEEYRAIETLRKGDLVKTFSNGYKPIDTIGTSKIYNPANSMRSLNRLYRCPKESYPSLTEDLVITGCHSILVKNITDEERASLLDIQEKIYVTEKHYRLIAAADKKAVPYEQEGLCNIWHLALEHPQYTFNYGVYANGLLVESSSMRMMRELSGMNLIQ